MSKTPYHANLIGGTSRGIAMAAWTPYLALYTGDPLAGGAEVLGGSYARQLVVFGAMVGLIQTNTNNVVFPNPTGLWGNPITHLGLVDALAGGNLREYYQATGSPTDRLVTVGSTPVTLGPGTIILGEP